MKKVHLPIHGCYTVHDLICDYKHSIPHISTFYHPVSKSGNTNTTNNYSATHR